MHQKTIRGLNLRYSAMQSLYWMSFAVVTAFASVFLLSRGFSDGEIGVVLAIGNVLAVFLQSPVASFADRSRQVSISQIASVIGLAIIGFAILLLAAPHARTVSGLLFLLCLMSAMVLQPLTSAIGMFFVNRGYPLNFGLARGVGSVSYAALTAVVGTLIDRFGMDVVPVCLIVVYAGFLAALLLLDTRKSSYAAQEDEEQKSGEASSLPEFVLRYKKFMGMLAGVTLLFATHNIFNTYMFQIMQPLGGGSSDMGFSLAISAASELPTMLLFFWLIRRFRCKTLLRTSAVFFSVKALAILLSGSIVMMHAAQLLQMLAFALYTPAAVYYVNQNIEEKDHVKGQALSTTANTAGGVIGSLAGGQLLTWFGPREMMLAGLVMSVIGTAIVCLCVEDAGNIQKNA